jgi:hypothetical protein
MSDKPRTKRPNRVFKSLITVIISVGLLSGCSRAKGKLGDVGQLAPSDSVFIVSFDGLDSMVKQTGDILGNLGQFAAFLPPGAESEMASAITSATATIGFDPTNPSGYAAVGLDLDRPLAVIGVLQMGVTEPTLLTAIPVLDHKAFNAFIGRMASSVIQDQTVGSQTIYSIEKEAGCWLYKDNYMVHTERGLLNMECGQTLASALDSKTSLGESKSFKKMNAAMGKDWSIMSWLNIEGLKPLLAHQDPQSALMLNLIGVQSMALNLSDDKSTISFNSAVQFHDDSLVLKYLKTIDVSQDDALSEQLNGSPIAVARMKLNLPDLLDIARGIPSLQGDLMEISQELAEEGMTIDQVAGLIPSSVGGALFLEAAGIEFWIGGGVDGDTTALTAQIIRECDSGSSYRKTTTLQPLANGVACLSERRGEFEGFLTSDNIAAFVFGGAFDDPVMLQTGIIGRLMGIGGDAEGYGEEGLSDAASKALNAKGLATAYLDVPAALKSLSTNPEFVRKMGVMGAMGLGMAANAITEGMQARVWADDGMLKGRASINLEGMGVEGGSAGAVTVGLLAAIVIPNFVEMGYRAKRAEVPSNVKAIKEALEIYNAEMDMYLAVPSHPSYSAPGKKAQKWGSSQTGFNDLNWRPDGDVRGVYSVTTTAPSSRSPGGDFEVTGRIDCDGDGVEAVYTATKSINTRLITPNNTF